MSIFGKKQEERMEGNATTSHSYTIRNYENVGNGVSASYDEPTASFEKNKTMGEKVREGAREGFSKARSAAKGTYKALKVLSGGLESFNTKSSIKKEKISQPKAWRGDSFGSWGGWGGSPPRESSQPSLLGGGNFDLLGMGSREQKTEKKEHKRQGKTIIINL